MADAIGFIETKGLVGAVASADAMLKAADVTLSGKEVTGPALILIKITGDTASVKYAIEAGEMAAKNAGHFISSLVITDPDARLASLLPEINIEKIAPIVAQEPVQINSELSHNHGEQEELKPEINAAAIEEIKPDEEIEPVVEIEIKPDENYTENETSEEIKNIDIENPEQVNLPVEESKPVVKVRRISRKKVKAVNDAAKENIPVEVKHVEEEVPSEAEISETETIVNELPVAAEEIVEEKIVDFEVTAEGPELSAKQEQPEKIEEPVNVDEQENKNQVEDVPENNGRKKSKKAKTKTSGSPYHATLFDSLFEPIEDYYSGSETNNSTIARLKKEALGIDVKKESAPIIEIIPVTETTPEEEIVPVNETALETKTAEPVKPAEETKPAPIKMPKEIKAVKPKAKVKKEKNVTKELNNEVQSNSSEGNGLSAEITKDYLLTLNVHLLRKAARATKGFPIQGREISKANRQVLLDYFDNLI